MLIINNINIFLTNYACNLHLIVSLIPICFEELCTLQKMYEKEMCHSMFIDVHIYTYVFYTQMNRNKAFKDMC